MADNKTLTRIPGTLVGHWTSEDRTTGTTVILFPDGAHCGAVLLGTASSTRQMDVFQPTHISNLAHGMCLSGGSAFGLTAADGVMRFLESQQIGFNSGYGKVPSVPTAIIFDLAIATTRPNADSGFLAARCASSQPVEQGRIGVGAGATVSKWHGSRLPGGVGSYACDIKNWSIGALSVVNAVGSVRDPNTSKWIVGNGNDLSPPAHVYGDWKGNTTLVIVTTNAPLNGAQATLVAQMASAGLARTLYPAYTPFDGDGVFAFSTGSGQLIGHNHVAYLGHVAAKMVANSIMNAVHSAESPRKP